jgi:methanogenic corrinoid protein MtbC1
MLRSGATEATAREATTRDEGARAAAAADQDMCSLVEDEIIPRLVAAHRLDDPPGRASPAIANPAGPPLDPQSVAEAALLADVDALMGLFEGALVRGADIETLLVAVMAPAARHLGTRWEDDSLDFVDVTMGLWRLQEVVRGLCRRDGGWGGAPGPGSRRSILCTVVPGDDHSFGSVIVEEIFRRAGWSVSGYRSASRAELLSALVADWYDVVALTVTVETPSATLADLVGALRAASRNPDVGIMVGGRIFADRPALAIAIGADATAGDARGALVKAERLVERYEVEDRSPRRAGASAGPAPWRRGLMPG